MQNIVQDLKIAIRVLRRDLLFTLVTLSALALGIAANTVIFSAFNAVMLRPLDYRDPERIVTVWDSIPQAGISKFGVTYANFADLKERNKVFQPLAIYQAASNTTFNLTGLSGPERVQGAKTAGDFFDAMGVGPILGRTVATTDEDPGRNHVAVIGYNLWQREFGGDASAVGRSVRINDEDYQIVGIMPSGFEFPRGAEMPAGQQFASATEIWTPLTIPPQARNERLGHSYRAVGRLKPGVTLPQAKSEMGVLMQQLVSEHPDENQGLSISLLTVKENQVDKYKAALWVLLAAVGFVLLIACVNIANLLLSRAVVRQKEFAIRAALGAGRRRILQQLLTESVVLSLLGGVLGVLLSFVAIRFLVRLAPADVPRIAEIGLDFRVLLFALGISFVAGILFGLAPAISISKSNLTDAVNDSGKGSSSGVRQNRMRKALVVCEVTMVFVLLIAAGLVMKSFRRLSGVDPGFDSSNVLTARITLPSVPYPGQKRPIFYHQLLDVLNQQPDVDSAAIVRDLPLSGTDPRYGVTVDGRALDAQNGGYTVRYRVISPNYFKALRIPMERGRYFSGQDTHDSPGVIIINASAANRIFPGEDPIGKTLLPGGNIAPERCSVVGVVRDIKFGGLESEPDPEIYVAYTQLPDAFIPPSIGSVAVVIRTNGKAPNFTPQLRQDVQALDKDVPVSFVQTMDDVVAGSIAAKRFNVLLMLVFAGFALMLAALGIYGVLSYWVSQRTREIGIRMALGAQRKDVLKLVLGQAMLIVLIGLGVGSGISLLLGRLLASSFSGLLFGVNTSDVSTFVGVGIVLSTVSLLACYVPAFRAIRVEPSTALRSE